MASPIQDLMRYTTNAGDVRYQGLTSSGKLISKLTEEKVSQMIESGAHGPSLTEENLEKLREIAQGTWMIDEVLGQLRKVQWADATGDRVSTFHGSYTQAAAAHWDSKQCPFQQLPPLVETVELSACITGVLVSTTRDFPVFGLETASVSISPYLQWCIVMSKPAPLWSMSKIRTASVLAR